MKKEGDMIIKNQTPGEVGDVYFLLLLGLLVLFVIVIASLDLVSCSIVALPYLTILISFVIADLTVIDIEPLQAIDIVNSEPTDPAAWLILGHIMEAKGDKASAQDCYEEALSITLPSMITSLQPEAGFLLPSMVMRGKTQTKANLTSNRFNHKTALFASRPQLTDLSRMIKLLVLLMLVLAWSQLFSFLVPLVQLLEYIFIPLLIMIGLWFTLQTFSLFKIALASYNWQPVKALIIGSYIQLYKEQKTYELYLACMYQIKEKSYYSLLPSADVYGYQPLWFNSGQYARASSESVIRDIQKKHAFGKVVTIYLDPEKPELVTDKRGLHSQVRTNLFIFASWALLCWLLAYIMAVYG